MPVIGDLHLQANIVLNKTIEDTELTLQHLPGRPFFPDFPEQNSYKPVTNRTAHISEDDITAEICARLMIS